MKKYLLSLLMISSFTLGFCESKPAEPSSLPPLPAMSTGNAEGFFLIDPKMRASDYIQAFEMLRKEKTTNKIFFNLKDGTSLSNIIEISPVGSGSLLLFKLNSPQGIRFQIVGVENLVSINHM